MGWEFVVWLNALWFGPRRTGLGTRSTGLIEDGSSNHLSHASMRHCQTERAASAPIKSNPTRPRPGPSARPFYACVGSVRPVVRFGIARPTRPRRPLCVSVAAAVVGECEWFNHNNGYVGVLLVSPGKENTTQNTEGDRSFVYLSVALVLFGFSVSSA